MNRVVLFYRSFTFSFDGLRLGEISWEWNNFGHTLRRVISSRTYAVECPKPTLQVGGKVS